MKMLTVLKKTIRSIRRDGIDETRKLMTYYAKQRLQPLFLNLYSGKQRRREEPGMDSFEENIDFSQYQTDIKPLALYLPQYHCFPENDIWWGKGFTEWTNVKKAEPLFDGHNQPRIPLASFGYYNLLETETFEKQIQLAKQHGIYGFAFYYYWFSGKKLMEKPLELYLSHPEYDFPFMLIWANENWTRSWDGLEQNVLIQQQYLEKDPENFICDIKPFLEDPRYIRIQGKPVIGIYALASLPDPQKTLEQWRQTARRIGVGEIFILGCFSTILNAALLDKGETDLQIVNLFDGTYIFPPRGISQKCRAAVQHTYDYKKAVDYARQNENVSSKVFLYDGTMVQWDSSPRRNANGNLWINYSPNNFYIYNRIAVSHLRKNLSPDNRFLFINAWNEWGEGTYLEPDMQDGYAAINALSKAIFDLPFGNHPQSEVFYTGCGLPFSAKADWDHALKSNCRIAVQVHIFYTELMEEVAAKLESMPYSYDLYISTDTEKKKNRIEAFFEKHSTARNFTVQVFPNKGRDIVPMIMQMKPVFHQYSYFLHVHTKRTSKNYTGKSAAGDIWRTFLYQNLLGSGDIVRDILFRFETDKALGILFPDYPAFIKQQIKWGSDKPLSEQLFRQWGLKSKLPNDPVFPAGNMFWGRTDALRQVFDCEYSEDDFPEENGQVDGTPMHAIERLWIYVARDNGFTYRRIRNFDDNQPLDLD